MDVCPVLLRVLNEDWNPLTVNHSFPKLIALRNALIFKLFMEALANRLKKILKVTVSENQCVKMYSWLLKLFTARRR